MKIWERVIWQNKYCLKTPARELIVFNQIVFEQITPISIIFERITLVKNNE